MSLEGSFSAVTMPILQVESFDSESPKILPTHPNSRFLPVKRTFFVLGELNILKISRIFRFVRTHARMNVVLGELNILKISRIFRFVRSDRLWKKRRPPPPFTVPPKPAGLREREVSSPSQDAAIASSLAGPSSGSVRQREKNVGCRSCGPSGR
jgi:hypothetical protein